MYLFLCPPLPVLPFFLVVGGEDSFLKNSNHYCDQHQLTSKNRYTTFLSTGNTLHLPCWTSKKSLNPLENASDKQKISLRSGPAILTTVKPLLSYEYLFNVFSGSSKTHGCKSEENPDLLGSKTCYLFCNACRNIKHVQT